MTTLHDLEVSWDHGLWTLSFGLSQFHGHGSWLVCEVALKCRLNLSTNDNLNQRSSTVSRRVLACRLLQERKLRGAGATHSAILQLHCNRGCQLYRLSRINCFRSLFACNCGDRFQNSQSTTSRVRHHGQERH
jgi:hypothetical protein